MESKLVGMGFDPVGPGWLWLFFSIAYMQVACWEPALMVRAPFSLVVMWKLKILCWVLVRTAFVVKRFPVAT